MRIENIYTRTVVCEKDFCEILGFNWFLESENQNKLFFEIFEKKVLTKGMCRAIITEHLAV